MQSEVTSMESSVGVSTSTRAPMTVALRHIASMSNVVAWGYHRCVRQRVLMGSGAPLPPSVCPIELRSANRRARPARHASMVSVVSAWTAAPAMPQHALVTSCRLARMGHQRPTTVPKLAQTAHVQRFRRRTAPTVYATAVVHHATRRARHLRNASMALVSSSLGRGQLEAHCGWLGFVGFRFCSAGSAVRGRQRLVVLRHLGEAAGGSV